jgi:hypothetical protein
MVENGGNPFIPFYAETKPTVRKSNIVVVFQNVAGLDMKADVIVMRC